MKPRQRLGSPVFVHGPRNPLNQFLAVGLQPLCLTLCLLVVYHLHRNFPTHFSSTHLEDLQDHTIILDFYSTMLCFRMSIMSARQRTYLSALAGKLDFASRGDKRKNQTETYYCYGIFAVAPGIS